VINGRLEGDERSLPAKSRKICNLSSSASATQSTEDLDEIRAAAALPFDADLCLKLAMILEMNSGTSRAVILAANG